MQNVITEKQLDEALASVDHVERVVLRVLAGGIGFQLFGDGREVVTGVAPREQLAEMLQVTEVLLNAELGLRRERLCLAGGN